MANNGKCGKCNGKGYIVFAAYVYGQTDTRDTCSKCGGTGKVKR